MNVKNNKIMASGEFDNEENERTRTRSFASLSKFSGGNFFHFYFYDSLKGFYWKKFFSTIITTLPVILMTWSSANFL